MSLLVVGLSHHQAPIDLLERVSLDPQGRLAMLRAAGASDNVGEVVVLSTCNRTEVYVDALTFHGALSDLSAAIATVTGVAHEELADLFYLHFEDRAIAHAFRVAGGLDSMAVGESQIRSQLRTSLREAQDARFAGPVLNTLFQQALRVGKRIHTETSIDAVSGSLVDTGFRAAGERLGDLTELDVLVVGAGGMAALAAQAAARSNVRSITVANRTLARGVALAERVGGAAIRLGEVAAAVADVDVVLSCTGAVGVVLDAPTVAAAQSARGGRGQVYLDLALPHDIDHAVALVPGTTRLGLGELGGLLAGVGDLPAVRQADDLVTAEVASYLTARAAEAAAPAIAAMRTRAGAVLQAELDRLDGRVPELSANDRREVEIALGRLVDKLLHAPTLRAKELAAHGRHTEFADALAHLFALDPREIANVSTPPPGPDEGAARAPLPLTGGDA